MTAPTDADVYSLLDDPRSRVEDVFRDTTSARAVYRQLARRLHPDHNPGDATAATRFARLATLWDEYQRLVADGTYGTARIVITSRRNTYRVTNTAHTGHVATVHRAVDQTNATVAVKVANAARDSDLIDAEARALRTLTNDPTLIDYAAFFPTVREAFAVRTPGHPARRAVVTNYVSGWYPLTDAASAQPRGGGLQPRDAAWIYRRVLTALGAAHSVNLIHGAPTGDHILIHPEQHGLMLIDWTASTDTGGKVPYLNAKWNANYPQGVLRGQPVTPGHDLYIASSVMLRLTPTANHPLRRFWHGASLNGGQPQDAWSLLAEFDDLLLRMWGQPKFHEFTVTGRTPT